MNIEAGRLLTTKERRKEKTMYENFQAPDSYDRYVAREEEHERRQEAWGRHKRQQFELFEMDTLYPACPNCGEHDEPVYFDFGTDSQTGYHDAGEACRACMPGRS